MCQRHLFIIRKLLRKYRQIKSTSLNWISQRCALVMYVWCRAARVCARSWKSQMPRQQRIEYRSYINLIIRLLFIGTMCRLYLLELVSRLPIHLIWHNLNYIWICDWWFWNPIDDCECTNRNSIRRLPVKQIIIFNLIHIHHLLFFSN